jgi:hypothetical protein
MRSVRGGVIYAREGHLWGEGHLWADGQTSSPGFRLGKTCYRHGRRAVSELPCPLALIQIPGPGLALAVSP